MTIQADMPTTEVPACALFYKYTGKERDTESGLDMFGARYYGSSLGRFMTPDWAAKPTNVPYMRVLGIRRVSTSTATSTTIQPQLAIQTDTAIGAGPW